MSMGTRLDIARWADRGWEWVQEQGGKQARGHYFTSDDGTTINACYYGCFIIGYLLETERAINPETLVNLTDGDIRQGDLMVEAAINDLNNWIFDRADFPLGLATMNDEGASVEQLSEFVRTGVEPDIMTGEVEEGW